jgi:hypothetical protein
MAKKIKAKTAKSVETKDLEPKDVKDVKGGKKAGTGQQEYLIVTMDTAIVES